jgi:hypothetical protein
LLQPLKLLLRLSMLLAVHLGVVTQHVLPLLLHLPRRVILIGRTGMIGRSCP